MSFVIHVKLDMTHGEPPDALSAQHSIATEICGARLIWILLMMSFANMTGNALDASAYVPAVFVVNEEK